ncbi:MAG: phosphatase PAP2 family protein [Dechloromonas sp.]|nr:phosphatase PAP2 family protein [Dechloromonas sp.]
MKRSAIAIPQEETQAAWHRLVAAVLFRHVYLKGIGTTVFITLFFNAYFYLLKNPAYPITVMPFTWFDGLIAVQPLALPIYVSMWVYVSLPPALLATRRELWFYGAAIAATCLGGLLVFYWWPTAVPAADVDWTQFPELDFLKNIDASGNACPSLHVATAVFSGVWLHHLLRRFGGPWWILSVNWTWCIGIVYSTMATRQHVALDVLGGLVLGLLAAWLSLRHRLVPQEA